MSEESLLQFPAQMRSSLEDVFTEAAAPINVQCSRLWARNLLCNEKTIIFTSKMTAKAAEFIQTVGDH